MKNALLIGVVAITLSGCASLISSATSGFTDNLSASILNQDDPETAKAALPTFMVTIDSLLRNNPNDPDLLASGATLYASYGAIFADDEVRASRLTSRARRYALSAMCETYAPACGWPDNNYDEFVATLDGIKPKHSEVLYTYGFASLAYLRAHSADWNSLAELPQVEALFNHYLDISGDEVNGSVYTYMGFFWRCDRQRLGASRKRPANTLSKRSQ